MLQFFDHSFFRMEMQSARFAGAGEIIKMLEPAKVKLAKRLPLNLIRVNGQNIFSTKN